MQEALRWRYASIAYRHGVRLRDSDEDEDEEAGAAGWTEEDDEAVTGARRASLTTSLELCRVLIQTCALARAHARARGRILVAWAAEKEEKTWGKNKGA